MSVWNHLLVAPQEARLLTRDQFAGLLHDLLRHEIVMMPCALLSGDFISVGSSLSIANNFIHHSYIDGKWITFPLDFPSGTRLHGKQGGTSVVHYCGEDIEELLKAVSSAPYGTRDICVWFEGLNWDNNEISSALPYNADVLVYSLTKPQKLSFFYEDSEEGELMGHELAGNEIDEYKDVVEEELGWRGIQMRIYAVQSCFRTIGNGGPFKTYPLMDAIFERYFSKDFIVDYSCS
jgi:hypothetical protein